MYDDLLRKKIIIEFAKLIKNAKGSDNELNSYAEFMKEVILNTSGLN